MLRSILTATLFAASIGIASAQMAPPPGAVTHQGTKTVPSPKAMHKKSTGSKSMMMHGMKATPKPKS